MTKRRPAAPTQSADLMLAERLTTMTLNLRNGGGSSRALVLLEAALGKVAERIVGRMK